MQNRIDNNLFWFDLFTVLAPCILTLIFYVLPGTEIHQDRAYQTAVTTLWLRWYTSLVILLNTTIPSMIIQQSSDEQLTSSHKEIHQLGKNCVMLQGKIAFICFSLHASEGPTVEIWLSAQSVMLSWCLYDTIDPTSNIYGTGNNK